MDDPPCNCSNRVSIEYLSEGRYRLGDKTLFIRVSAVNTHTHIHTLSLSLQWQQTCMLARFMSVIQTIQSVTESSHSEVAARL